MNTWKVRFALSKLHVCTESTYKIHIQYSRGKKKMQRCQFIPDTLSIVFHSCTARFNWGWYCNYPSGPPPLPQLHIFFCTPTPKKIIPVLSCLPRKYSQEHWQEHQHNTRVTLSVFPVIQAELSIPVKMTRFSCLSSMSTAGSCWITRSYESN